jgi:hypothetical protein
MELRCPNSGRPFGASFILGEKTDNRNELVLNIYQGII